MAGSTSVRLERTISAQALLATSATSEIAATTPKNKNVGRACGNSDGRSELGAGAELSRAGANAAGATEGKGASGASSAGASLPTVGGMGSGGSPFMIARVPTLADGERPACSV